MRVPSVDEMFGQEAAPKERTRYYPSQSAKNLLKDYFELNPPTRLDPSHTTTSFNVDQMIQFARAVGLEVSLASYSMLEDLLLKARKASGAHSLTSRYTGGKSPFPSVAGSSRGIVLLLGRFILCRLSVKLRVRMLLWVEMLLKNLVFADRQMLVWPWEQRVLKDRELTV